MDRAGIYVSLPEVCFDTPDFDEIVAIKRISLVRWQGHAIQKHSENTNHFFNVSVYGQICICHQSVTKKGGPTSSTEGCSSELFTQNQAAHISGTKRW